MEKRQIGMVTVGVMLSLFMAAMESTVVATAMPTIVGQLGGLEHYSWVFSAYMLASTTTVPLYGKVSDLYGRRKLFIFSTILFLAGSALSGLANSMTSLIVFRTIQGLGAGGLMPLAFIMIGEMFSLEQRARMQGLFSGVWGFASIIGPLLGGFLVDQLSWRWVFYVNIIPGLISAVLVMANWRDAPRLGKQLSIDYGGAALLTASVTALLLGLVETGTAFSWTMLALAVILFGALLWVERRVEDPVLPLALFKDRLFTLAIIHGILAGWAMFGSTSYIPLFVQAVLGTTATEAGITIAPMLLGWVFASIIGTRLLLKIGYRPLVLAGMVSLSLGTFLMSQAGVNSSQPVLMAYVALMGIGMGLSVPAFLIAVQSTVSRRQLGTATSTVQFSRTIGGTLGVSVMGWALAMRLAEGLRGTGLELADLQALLNGAPGADAVPIDTGLRVVLANGINLVFLIAFGAALLGLVAVFAAPRQELVENRGELDESTQPVSAD